MWVHKEGDRKKAGILTDTQEKTRYSNSSFQIEPGFIDTGGFQSWP
jgi:hypothetical protein